MSRSNRLPGVLGLFVLLALSEKKLEGSFNLASSRFQLKKRNNIFHFKSFLKAGCEGVEVAFTYIQIPFLPVLAPLSLHFRSLLPTHDVWDVGLLVTIADRNSLTPPSSRGTIFSPRDLDFWFGSRKRGSGMQRGLTSGSSRNRLTKPQLPKQITHQPISLCRNRNPWFFFLDAASAWSSLVNSK